MNKQYTEPETNNVIGVQFSILGPEEIKSRSVVEITKHETYDKDTPVIKGLFDIHVWGLLRWARFAQRVVKITLIVQVILDMLNLRDLFIIGNLSNMY